MKLVQKQLQKQLQTLKLSYQMKLSFECLQLSTVDLKEYLEKKALENPLIELDINPVFYQTEYDFNQIAVENTSIQHEILRQLHLRKIQLNEELIETLVYLIDEGGYLPFTIDELKKITHANDEELRAHINWIKECEPIGIGAYNLKECLCLQAKALYPEDNFIYDLIDSELENIAYQKYDYLLNKYNCEYDELFHSIRLIRSLQPKPALNYSNENTQFIKPDVVMGVEEENLYFSCIDYYQIRINDAMQFLSEDTKKYVEQKYIEAQFLLNGLIKRKETLSKIMSVILSVQGKSILMNQPLKPLRLIDIANEINIHETTVSRALKNKYYELNGEIFPIHQLLSKQIKGKSVSEIKKSIQIIVENENKKQPLSDAKIQLLLKEKGYILSIRTINKYREELGIKNKKLRRISDGKKC